MHAVCARVRSCALVCAFRSFDGMRNVFRAAKHHLSEILSAVEFVDRAALDVVLAADVDARDPLAEPFPFYMLIETAGRCGLTLLEYSPLHARIAGYYAVGVCDGVPSCPCVRLWYEPCCCSDAGHDSAKLERFMEASLTAGTVGDGVVAADSRQAARLWSLRENCSGALGRLGAVHVVLCATSASVCPHSILSDPVLIPHQQPSVRLGLSPPPPTDLTDYYAILDHESSLLGSELCLRDRSEYSS